MLNQQVILDRYRVIERAGRGGYATVLHAYDTLLKRDVAIKEIEISAEDMRRAREQASLRARPGSILPDVPALEDNAALPSDPSFLDKRDTKRRRSAEVASPSRVQSPSAQKRPRISLAGGDTTAIGALADQLPGVIQGAGAVKIDAVDGAGVELDMDELIPVEPRELPEELPVISVGEGAQSTVLPVLGTAQAARGAHEGTQSRWRERRASERGMAPEAQALDPAFYDNIPGLSEARSAAHLNDANIVTVYDCVVDNGSVYVIMEYVEGKTLARIMNDLQNDITLDMIAAVFTSVSHALEVAHGAKLLHLDVKPENVIISRKGDIKVTDFGLSTLMDSGGRGTTGGGTIGYMPLEQMRRQPLDVRTDEWGLASLTYEMLSGSNPFRAKTLREAEAAIENAELVLPSQCWASIDESIDDIIFQALDPIPQERFASVKDFASDMTPLLGDAKAGKKQLAKVVEGEAKAEEEKEDKREPREPGIPLIDRLGRRGSSIAMRIFAGAAAAMVGALSLVNCRFATADTFGLLTSFPIAFWVLLAALVGVTAWKPRFGFPAVFGFFSVMLLFNQAWALGFTMMALTGAWWWFFGRESDAMCLAALLQPLFGSIGFAAISPVMAAVMLDVRQALLTSAFAACSAIAFAALGTGDLSLWDIMASFFTAANADIAGATITQTLMLTLSNPETWFVAASWIAGSGLYSLFCRRGTKVFDILGACVCAACIVAGVLLDVFVNHGPLLIFNVLAAVTCGGAGVVMAVMEIPDRLRMDEADWD